MKTRGRRPSAFIVFQCLETPMKHEARVFEIASQLKLKLRSRKRNNIVKIYARSDFQTIVTVMISFVITC